MFKLISKCGSARRGEYRTAHGTVQTPVFMNVGTQAAIKGGLSAHDLKTVGCQIELSNTYHLHVRPGEEIVKRLGGLGEFMKWDGPTLTDSGGFQVFSLAKLRKIDEEGVRFNAHTDGHAIFMRPEDSMRIQWALGSDIAMAFDECVQSMTEKPYVQASCARTTRWLERCRAAMDELHRREDTVNPGQVLWGINQGAVYKDLRVEHMKRIRELELPGYAIGGLAVGEPTEQMYEIIETVEPYMPEDKPRYLMGVGTPSNILESVARGVDFFDCVMPARNARHGHLFTSEGIINLNNAKYQDDPRPVDAECACPVCRTHSRAYLRHMLRSGEMLGMRLAVMHNLHFYNTLMADIRREIEQGTFEDFRRKKTEVLAKRI
ncbi:MAG: tRNA guanosine(34) transglycosylase Tgt [Clostridia bacterium]|nr:tRNA guanosine(34) transglycosylase Tgt [Clostridia bacterium]